MISEEYLAQCKQLHADRPHWGSYAASKHAQNVRRLIDAHACKSVLDYGCGKGSLRVALGQIVHNYDPATFPQRPEPADLVCCLDVLEHVEPEHIGAVLADLQRLTKKVAFFVIATTPAVAVLPDGRNAHLIVEGVDWWLQRIFMFFDVLSFSDRGHELHFVLGRA